MKPKVKHTGLPNRETKTIMTCCHDVRVHKSTVTSAVPIYPADAEKDSAYIFDAKLQEVLALVHARCAGPVAMTCSLIAGGASRLSMALSLAQSLSSCVSHLVLCL